MKNQNRNNKLPDPKNIREAASKIYVDNKFNEPSIIKNSTQVDFKDKNLDNVRFIKVNSMPAVGEPLTAKYFVDNAISHSVDESSLLTLYPNEKIKLDEQASIIPNSTLISSKTIIEIPAKSYVDHLHESSRNRRDLSSVFNDQDIEFDNTKLTHFNSVTVNRNPSSDNELANKMR